ncbi:MAG: PqqD family protein [Pseudaminobacter sp.]|nr:PqqD family protein [Pseudaminobacter sp.]
MTGSQEVSLFTRLALSPNVTVQALGENEGGVLLRLDSGELYTVNDTTLAFLQELDGERAVVEVVGRLAGVFDVEEATLTADLVEISNDLLAESLIVITA